MKEELPGYSFVLVSDEGFNIVFLSLIIQLFVFVRYIEEIIEIHIKVFVFHVDNFNICQNFFDIKEVFLTCIDLLSLILSGIVSFSLFPVGIL
jgi:hypothetical protein